MAHLCPACNEECHCNGDTGRVVSVHMPVGCEHCEVVDELEDFEDEPEVDEMDFRPGRRW